MQMQATSKSTNAMKRKGIFVSGNVFKNKISVTLLAYSLLHFIWGVGSLKILAMPISIIFFLSRRKDVIMGLSMGLLSILIYFVIHGYNGSHDFKAFLVVFHFIVPAAVCHWSIRKKYVTAYDILIFAAAFFLINIILPVDAFVINGLDDSQDRFRGFILPLLFILLFINYSAGRLLKLSMLCFLVIFTFLISGHRGATLISAGSMFAIWMRRDIYLWSIPLLHLVTPLAVIWYGIMFPNLDNNIVVRAKSATLVLESLTPFGHGMAPPISEFLGSGNFEHFFVPADVLYFGALYEMGYVILLMKAAFIIYLARRYWHTSDKAVVIVICSTALFGYHLTHDLFELVSAAIIFGFIRKNVLLP